MFALPIQELKSQHDRIGFFCGIDALDSYLRERAGQDIRSKYAVVYVQLEDDGKTIAGYYTLASTSINVGALPPELVKQLPKYPLVPATLIGRLARDQRYVGKNLGERLLVDSLRRSYEYSHRVAATAVIVEAKDESAVKFYMKYGFAPFPDQPARLFIMMSTIAKLYGKNV